MFLSEAGSDMFVSWLYSWAFNFKVQDRASMSPFSKPFCSHMFVCDCDFNGKFSVRSLYNKQRNNNDNKSHPPKEKTLCLW